MCGLEAAVATNNGSKTKSKKGETSNKESEKLKMMLEQIREKKEMTDEKNWEMKTEI